MATISTTTTVPSENKSKNDVSFKSITIVSYICSISFIILVILTYLYPIDNNNIKNIKNIDAVKFVGILLSFIGNIALFAMIKKYENNATTEDDKKYVKATSASFGLFVSSLIIIILVQVYKFYKYKSNYLRI